MALAAYADLIASVGSWLERDDVSTLAPDWIALAEARVNRELRTAKQITRATATITDEFSALPTNFLAPRSMRLTGASKRHLQYLSPEQMADLKQTLASGPLAYYTAVGAEFEYGPIPVAATEVSLTYYAKVPALSVSNTSNWLLTAHPDVYLRGSLLEAGLFYEDDEITSKNQTLFVEAIGRIQDAERRDAFAANLTPMPSGFAA